MTSQIGPGTLRALGTLVAVCVAVGVDSALALPAWARLESGTYQSAVSATAEEQGDRVANGSRIVPLSATLTFDLDDAEPILTAFLRNAVLEGGDPFELLVHSSSGTQLADGTYRFTGDYLAEISSTPTQYLFDWRFSSAGDGNVAWNGTTYWAGGHIWLITVSDVALVPRAAADFDEDNDVDADDLTTWQSGYGLATGAVHANGDSNGDADVDGEDFLKWQRQLGLSTLGEFAAIPEPTSTIHLLASAAALLLVVSRHR